MPVTLLEKQDGKVLQIKISGKLSKDDYHSFTPEVERLIGKHGKLRILAQTVDFDGWTAGALWEDIKFDAKHFNDIEKLAIVGDSKWEEGMAHFCKPFTTAEVRFFETEKLAEAETWVEA